MRLQICVNDEKRQIESRLLSDILIELGYESIQVATAVNGVFVSKAGRQTCELEDGASLEILAPMQGG